ncbi:MAG: hypothetical protein E7359_00455 [Clostridiales bacterium]|nr:hypothetical protein [Clostridiales bacterium]
MEFYLKIKTDFDCNISFNKFSKNLSKDKFINLKLNLNNNEKLTFNVEEENQSNHILLPYKFTLENIFNKLSSNSTNIDIFYYKNNYIIYLKKFEVIKDLNILYSDNEISIFNTFHTTITIKNTNLNLNDLYKIVEVKKINTNKIILLENEEKKYVVIFNNDNLIFQDNYNLINISKKIEIFSKINDITKHAIITNIENEVITKKIVYVNNKPKIINNSKIIPLVFLECLKIKNQKLCNYYLSDNLKEFASIDNLKLFFGDFIKLEPLGKSNSVVLFYKDKSYKIFTFSVENNKIQKIDLN